MWVIFTTNEIIRNTNKNIIQICACQPGMHSLVSKKRGILIKTSEGIKDFFEAGGGGMKSNSRNTFCEVDLFFILLLLQVMMLLQHEAQYLGLIRNVILLISRFKLIKCKKVRLIKQYDDLSLKPLRNNS